MLSPTPALRGLAATVLSALSLSAAHATTVSFEGVGTLTTPGLTIGGVVVTSSNLVKLDNLNGLGVIGGFNDLSVDGTEYLDFSFAGVGGATDVSYFTSLGGNLNSNNQVGERTLTIFGLGNILLGSFDEDDVGTFSVSNLVGNATIEHFRLQARQDYFTVNSLSFTAQHGGSVPEPTSLALAGLALAGVASTRRAAR